MARRPTPRTQSGQSDEPNQIRAYENIGVTALAVLNLVQAIKPSSISDPEHLENITKQLELILRVIKNDGNLELNEVEYSPSGVNPDEEGKRDKSPVKFEDVKPETPTVTDVLNQLSKMVIDNPDAVDELQAHELFKQIAKKKEVDPIALEIQEKIKVQWEDRKKPEYKMQDWSRNASTFIAFHFAEFLKPEIRLKLVHLKIQDKLYQSYNSLISTSPQWDLGLITEERVFHSDPIEALNRARRKNLESTKAYNAKQSTI